ncbi:MAG: helix-turn-helix domain-containing protein [Chitinophagales bacterium]
MNFYHQQLISIRNKHFPRENLCDQVAQARNFIEENFSNRIRLHDMASEACFSKFHFLRLFKLMYGKTPHQFLTEVRIKKAKQLLQTGLPVSEVCFLTGFESISSFKGLFKRYTCLTPASYQKQLKDKKEISQTAYRFLPFFFAFKKSNFQDRK